MVDCGGFQVGLDPRMRSNRRNYRVMHVECPRPKRAAGRFDSLGPTLDSGRGTRLSNGTEVDGPDDWACVQDMAKEGLLNLSDTDIEPGVTLLLSEKGKVWSDALREHKRAGLPGRPGEHDRSRTELGADAQISLLIELIRSPPPCGRGTFSLGEPGTHGRRGGI